MAAPWRAPDMVQVINVTDIKQYVGRQLGPSDWFTVTQDQIDLFADCINDHQFIHVDPEAAKNGPFGTTVAHGFLCLSMLSSLCRQFSPAIEGTRTRINYGLDNVRFLNPVKVNSKIRAHANVLAIDEKKPGQFVFRSRVQLEIRGEEKPALVADWITLQIL